MMLDVEVKSELETLCAELGVILALYLGSYLPGAGKLDAFSLTHIGNNSFVCFSGHGR